MLTDIAIVTLVLPSLVQSFLNGLRAFAAGVTAWGQWLDEPGAPDRRPSFDALMSLDLIGYVLRKFLPDWLVGQLPVPSVTLNDIVLFLTGQGAEGVKDKLDTFFDRALRLINAADHLPWVDLENFYWRVDALAKGVRHGAHSRRRRRRRT